MELTRWRPGLRRHCYVGVSLLAAVALALTLAQRAAATAAVQYMQTASSPTLPTGGTQGYLGWSYPATTGGVDCVSGSCVAVGSYSDASNNNFPLITSTVQGTAGPGILAQLPAGASVTGSKTGLNSVSCWSANACIAVGEYGTPNSDYLAMVTPISGGQPGTGIDVSMPGDINTTYPTSNLNSVSCWSAGSCLSVGDYYNVDSQILPIVVSISNSKPGAAVNVTLPSNANKNLQQSSALNDVKCWSSTQCVAVGDYYDDSSSSVTGNLVPLVVQISNGAATSHGVTLPSTGSGTSLNALSCSANGSCYAVGYYGDASGSEALVVPIANGVPAAPVRVPLPTGGSNAALYSISCVSATECYAVGNYEDGAGAYQAMLVPITNGNVGNALEITAPSSPTASGKLQNGELKAIGCVPAGTCIAGGDYLDTNNIGQAMTLKISNGSIGSAAEAPLPNDASTTAPFPYISAINCDQSGSCLAVGEYDNTTGNMVPLELQLQQQLAITTTTLPAGTVGSAYQQTTLSASGAWGSYSWSVSNGSLPAGLTLDPQTGVISGTPSAAGNSSFTVEVTGTGASAQTATQQLSIDVASAPVTTTPTPAPPHPSAPGGALKLSGNLVNVPILCTGSTCTGTVKLTVTEVVVVKHGHKRVRRHRTVVIGSAHFSVTAGHRGNVHVKLNAAGRRLLAKAKRHRLRVRVVASAKGGHQTSHSATIVSAVTKKHHKR